MVNVIAILSFVGMRVGELVAVTAPTLLTPKGKTADGKYPWGGRDTRDTGLLKVAKVRGIFGAVWSELVTNERLRTGEGADANGDATYTHGDATNGTVWVRDGGGQRLAFKTNRDETSLYVPVVVCESLGYDYFTTSGLPVAKDSVTPFLRDTSREGIRQRLTNPLVYRDYRADRVSELRIGQSIADGDAIALAEALLNGDRATVARIMATGMDGAYA